MYQPDISVFLHTSKDINIKFHELKLRGADISELSIDLIKAIISLVRLVPA